MEPHIKNRLQVIEESLKLLRDKVSEAQATMLNLKKEHCYLTYDVFPGDHIETDGKKGVVCPHDEQPGVPLKYYPFNKNGELSKQKKDLYPMMSGRINFKVTLRPNPKT
jgi:hypothetical protein